MKPIASTDAGPSRAVLHLHDGLAAWTTAASARIADRLRTQLAGDSSARLLLSGGSTPAPVYRALAREPLDWARIVVSLVDERWLPAGDPASNGRLVGETLLTGLAAAARFEPMLSGSAEIDDAVAQANERARPATVAVFGMGPDGHTASLFPRMNQLQLALGSPDDYIGVDASGCEGAQEWPRRVTLTPAGIARSSLRLLLVRGEQKLALLRTAMAGDDVNDLPVRTLWSVPGAPLEVYWCP